MNYLTHNTKYKNKKEEKAAAVSDFKQQGAAVGCVLLQHYAVMIIDPKEQHCGTTEKISDSP